MKELDRGLTHDFAKLSWAERPGQGPGGPGRGRARLAGAGGRKPGSVTVPGPLARALASELSRCHAGGDRPGALPGRLGRARQGIPEQALTVNLWLKLEKLAVTEYP